VHVLVQEHQGKKISCIVTQVIPVTFLTVEIEHLIENSLHVSYSFPVCWKRQVPTRFMGHARGVVKSIATIEHRLSMVQMTQGPILLKPGNVSNLPAQRINYTQARADQLVIVQVSSEGERPFSNLLEEFKAFDYSRTGRHN